LFLFFIIIINKILNRIVEVFFLNCGAVLLVVKTVFMSLKNGDINFLADKFIGSGSYPAIGFL